MPNNICLEAYSKKPEVKYAGWHNRLDMASGRQTTFGEAARLRRVELGLSQKQVAERAAAGFDQALVSKIEKSKVADPGVSIAHALARALECTVEDLMAGSSVTPPVLGDETARPPDFTLAAVGGQILTEAVEDLRRRVELLEAATGAAAPARQKRAAR